MSIQVYQKGDIIFRQGDAADCMYDIRWGSVGIYAGYGTPQQKLLATLESDSYFGEMGMIDGAPRSATAVALEKDTRLQAITEGQLGVLFQERPAKVLTIMQQLSASLRRLTKNYMDACKTAAGVVSLEESGDADADTVRSQAAHYARAGQDEAYIGV